jgi:E3 ubiquitin-protein ligase TRIP12
MPILQNVLASHDQKVVEQGCLCVTRVIDSFKHSPEKLEQLVDAPLLKAVLGLLLPGTVNLIGAGIHTEFLRVLAIVARASPRLSVELLKMNVVDTLYQILTGVSPPSDTSDVASKIDSVVVMQALIHRPREQVYETLNVICELLPKTKGSSVFVDDFDDEFYNGMSESPRRSRSKPSANDKRLELLEECKLETRRFAMILFPTLTDAYSSTVNLNVRQKVLTAQLKMLSNLDTRVIEDALRPVPYASFLASILSQEDHPSLVMFALRASEILFERLENIYQYQFYREGVIAEIKKLADRPLDMDLTSLGSSGLLQSSSPRKSKRTKTENQDVDLRDDINEKEDLDQDVTGNEDELVNDNDVDEDDDEDGIDDDGENDEDEDDNENENEDEDEDEEGGDIVVQDEGHAMSESPSSDSSDEDLPSPIAMPGSAELIIISSKQFLELYETSKGNVMRAKAASIRQDLQELATEIEVCYLGDGNGDGKKLFVKLAEFFDGDALESITSSELLSSGIIRVFLEVFGSSGTRSTIGNPEADFLAAFGTSRNGSTAFSVLIHKLQDLLSRAEHFEVLTVNNSASETSRSNSTSMLSKQLRLKLTADADSDIPPSYRDITVSIHAIATFKALDDYLRPRISLSERPPSARRREMLAHLANARMRELSGLPDAGLFPPGMDAGSLSAAAPSAPKSKSRSSSKTKLGSSEKGEANAASKDEKPTPRRSSRRSQPSTSNAPPEAPTASSETPAPNVECADEKHIEDQADAEAAQALEAIVDDLEDDMSDDDVAEPSAVNMEIASTGKVTARKEDGTRVSTPLQPGTPVTATARPAS